MSNENPKKNVKIIYLIVGLIAVVIAIFDLTVKNYYDTALSFSLGILFIFIGSKTSWRSKLSSKSVNIIHYILLVIVIVTSIAKLVYRLKIL